MKDKLAIEKEIDKVNQMMKDLKKDKKQAEKEFYGSYMYIQALKWVLNS